MRAALAVALLAAAASAEARTPKRAHPARHRAAPEPRRAPVHHGPGVGAVVYATRGRGYVDAGSADGLAAGEAVELRRGGAAAGTCRLEAVAAHHASCRGEVQVGDTFALPGRVPPPRPAELPEPLPVPEMERRAAAVAAVAVQKVDFHGAPAPPAVQEALPRVEAAIGHATWAASGQGPWQEERVDLSINGADLPGGLQLFLDMRALRWTTRPPARFRPNDQTQVYVWQAEVASRPMAPGLSLAAGRVLSWFIPGASTFDGAQVGWRSGTTEVGLFGGAVPDPLTLDPTVQRSTAGVYGVLDQAGSSVAAREEFRLAVVTSPELGTRTEGEASTFVLLGKRLNVSGDVRFGVGGERQAPFDLDAVRLDVSGRLLERLVISAGFRYEGLFIPDSAAPALFLGPERQLDATLGWEAWSGVVLSGTVGAFQDLTTGLQRAYAGPDVSLPRLFGPRGGLSLGYVQEVGWSPGRSAYAQASLLPVDRLRLVLRLFYAADTRFIGAADTQLGVSVSADALLSRWVALRLSALARTGGQNLAQTSWLSYGLTGISSLVVSY